MDILRLLFGYWPRRHSACPVVSRVLLADLGQRGDAVLGEARAVRVVADRGQLDQLGVAAVLALVMSTSAGAANG